MPATRLTVWDDAACWRVHGATRARRLPASLVDVALQSAPRTQGLRREPRAHWLDQTVRDRLRAVFTRTGGSTL